MNWLDPDHPDPRYIQELLEILDAAMYRAKQEILHPKGRTPESIEWNRTRALQVNATLQREFDKARKLLPGWSNRAISSAIKAGSAAAQKQIDALVRTGIDMPSKEGVLHFANPNLDVAKVLARDTATDGAKALDAAGNQMFQTLRKFSENGLTAKQVNQILAKSTIDGVPMSAQLELRKELERINGKQIVFPSGHVMNTQDYARTLARTRLREAHVIARHERLQANGIQYLYQAVGSLLLQAVGRDEQEA